MQDELRELIGLTSIYWVDLYSLKISHLAGKKKIDGSAKHSWSQPTPNNLNIHLVGDDDENQQRE